MKLTNRDIFERPFDEAKGDYVDQRQLLPTAMLVDDIHLMRTPVGGMRDTDGEHLGDAMADIPQRWVVHSPTGFEWGYGGSGPADLALNILGLFVAPAEAYRLHQDYKWMAIAPLNRHGPHTITAASVRAWLESHWAVERLAAERDAS